MANVKNGAFREIIIDRCLHTRRGYSTQEIFDKCNDALEQRGEAPLSALNTIRNDIAAIENRWHVVVEKIRVGREIRYRYEDSTFSIFKTPLTEDEIVQLSQSLSLLRRFEGMPGFEWVEEMLARIQTTVSTKMEPTVGFGDNKMLKGISMFTPLFKSITTKKPIKITYMSYKSDNILEDVIHPYYLKEYNQRWFLIAYNETYKSLSNFALDRIRSIASVKTRFIPNTTIDFAHYFDNVVGVTVPTDGEVQTVVLWVNAEQLPYILSKPIHSTQEVVEKREDGSAVISIRVIPNYELIQLLLSYGGRVVVHAPESLREEILRRIKESLQKYE